MNWAITPAADDDLIHGREWIEADNPEAAQSMLKTAKECFERLCQFPKSGADARFKGNKLSGLRFIVLSPPFNRWIVFYRVTKQIEIVRVLYGGVNRRQEPRRFF